MIKQRIEKKLQKKRNPELVETIIKAKKLKPWLKISHLLSYPRSKRIEVNLNKINNESKEGDTIVVPGKILGQGEIDKKLVVVAFNFSNEAREKLKNQKCETKTILEEIKQNPKAEGIRIIK